MWQKHLENIGLSGYSLKVHLLNNVVVLKGIWIGPKNGEEKIIFFKNRLGGLPTKLILQCLFFLRHLRNDPFPFHSFLCPPFSSQGRHEKGLRGGDDLGYVAVLTHPPDMAPAPSIGDLPKIFIFCKNHNKWTTFQNCHPPPPYPPFYIFVRRGKA